MTPQRAYHLGVRADACSVVSEARRYGGEWRVECEDRVVLTTPSVFMATGFVGRLRRLEAGA